MALAMARPWKHPQTGIYWLRKRVPEDVQRAVGKREEKFSLRTRDPAEAKRRHAAALVAMEERWANLRAPVRKLDNAELHHISPAAYQFCLQAKGPPGIRWDSDAAAKLWGDDVNDVYRPIDFWSDAALVRSFHQELVPRKGERVHHGSRPQGRRRRPAESRKSGFMPGPRVGPERTSNWIRTEGQGRRAELAK